MSQKNPNTNEVARSQEEFPLEPPEARKSAKYKLFFPRASYLYKNGGVVRKDIFLWIARSKKKKKAVS